jgi:predicted MFS family arabinose efflux permease
VNALQRFRAGCYAVEGVNSFALVLYSNYIYFFFRDRFDFNDRQNLVLAATMGLVYAVSSWQAGRFAQRFGCFRALKTGFALMAFGLALGWRLHTVPGQVAAAALVWVGMCFTWPSLEALVSEGDTPEHVPHAVGIYNITWAVTNAVSFFIGGTLIKKFGYQCIFTVPLVLMVFLFSVTFWLERVRPKQLRPAAHPAAAPAARARAASFQRMAWLSNPCAYIAINTLLAVLPGIAAKFHLSTMLAGFALSLWCFARVATFIVLWRWTGWHYRFRWLALAFVTLILSFASILIVPQLAVILLAQAAFGVAIGLIYYSSLFYSMDASDSKGEHGGIHEAAIGLGNFMGPAIGAGALYLAPGNGGMGAWAVSGLLVFGFAGLLGIRGWGKRA